MDYSLHENESYSTFVRANWFSPVEPAWDDFTEIYQSFSGTRVNTMAKYHRDASCARLLRESGSASATPIFVVGDLEVDEASAANRSGRMADQSFEDILFARRQESLLKFKTALASRSTSSTP
ncbi:hypothetical protein Pst134EA_002796 [Puccinia striiformis f. sp. tritici]|uniref:hypothetical protein n=1 Tax=Puccinia striiformis f. sp. tritici TaxID=168172 RepID=UPI0020076E01|nr:hypothetical protein Pst134EA_002796 [Puccinia striiformis f. sp. tritici]KAH9472171.1 hypothetical protein Pst134EA_002796 [Puccinia striiformis f. sp. tritici]